jgi:hypothetical protein
MHMLGVYVDCLDWFAVCPVENLLSRRERNLLIGRGHEFNDPLEGCSTFRLGKPLYIFRNLFTA